MECPKCRSNNKEAATRCTICAYVFKQGSEEKKQPETAKAVDTKKYNSVFSWRVTKEDFANQIDNYHSLKFFKTVRGAAITVTAIYIALIIAYVFVLTIQEPVEDVPLSFTIWFAVVFHLVIALLFATLFFFMYKGHRWALWIVIGLVTVNMILAFLDGFSVELIFWPLVLLPLYYKTVVVEYKRRKKDVLI